MVLIHFNAEKSAKSTRLVIRIDTEQRGTTTWLNSARGKYGQFSTETWQPVSLFMENLRMQHGLVISKNGAMMDFPLCLHGYA